MNSVQQAVQELTIAAQRGRLAFRYRQPTCPYNVGSPEALAWLRALIHEHILSLRQAGVIR